MDYMSDSKLIVYYNEYDELKLSMILWTGM